MSFFSRLTRIVKSNLNFGSESSVDIDIDEINKQYDEIINDDRNDIPDEIRPENTVEKEYYAILELPQGSDFSKIKSAYKKLLKKYHPDMFQNKPEKLKAAQKLTEKINEAYTYFEKKFQN
ncbi:J domain-containing protein [bacterium]|nr:J domain-containing protein [bacterium]